MGVRKEQSFEETVPSKKKKRNSRGEGEEQTEPDREKVEVVCPAHNNPVICLQFLHLEERELGSPYTQDLKP